MDLHHAFLEKIFWGVFLIILAAGLLVVWIANVPVIMVVPVVLLGMGGWVMITGASFYDRAWGIVLAVIGGLWLLRAYIAVPVYIAAALFLIVVGILIIVGSRM
ncbi:MAG: hypothetical protein HXS41_07600 [Theionarchaea archaeon]|nr:hypothetical protein [Theionarchaea archaeon]MBU7000193.1 hypothetical protein [Theionarchaea archaeon]MBU7020910.1 hypothetical protein [Theionarchaea archaeon]MBU7033962.1 hypothetical protein [Theionarchaea archaeon]MBU7040542.1 hypothetical protein [Theionarchaea archaeon]